MIQIELFQQQIQENPMKVYRDKLLEVNNLSNHAMIYQFLYYVADEVSTLEIMGYCYAHKITSYLRRLHELKNRGLIVNRIIKISDGTEYAFWKVKEIE